MLKTSSVKHSRLKQGFVLPSRFPDLQTRTVTTTSGVCPPSAEDEGQDRPCLWGEDFASESSEEERNVWSGDDHSLADVAMSYVTYDLESLAQSCGMKILECMQPLGYKWISLVTIDKHETVTTATNDSHHSGRHLLAFSLAKFVMGMGYPRIQIDLDLSERERNFNSDGVFGGPDGSSYQTYVKLMNGKHSGDAFITECEAIREIQTGCSELGNPRVILHRGENLHVHEVAEEDVPSYLEREGASPYFLAQKPKTTSSWVKETGNDRFSPRPVSPPGKAYSETVWHVVSYDNRDFKLLSVAPGPECDHKVDEVLRTLITAESEGRIFVPRLIEKVETAQCKKATVEDRNFLKAITPKLRPSTDDYVLFEEAIKLGKEGGLRYIRENGIRTNDVTIFGNCLNSGGLPKSYRKTLCAINGTDNPLLTKFHMYVYALSKQGSMQQMGRVPRDPAKVAIWQMIRSYKQVGLHPSVELNFDWCLDI